MWSFDPVEVSQFATALTEKWNVALQAAERLDDDVVGGAPARTRCSVLGVSRAGRAERERDASQQGERAARVPRVSITPRSTATPHGQ